MVESSIESAQSTPSNGSQRPQGLVLQSALAYQHAGRSVLPIAPGCKRPSIVEPTTGEIIDTPWKPYQTTPADEAQIRAWFPSDRLMGIGIACGPVSGIKLDGVPYGLEILDVDDEATLEAFIEAANWQGHSDLLARLVHQRTPGGAGHFAYVCAQWAGNTKLAQRQEGADAHGKPQIVTLIETRGEGGQAVVAPTPPGIHPDHPECGYMLVRGSWEDLPIITPEERQALWNLTHSFNAYVEPEQVYAPRGAGRPGASSNRPGDWLNRTADSAWWRDLLERHDWTLIQERRGIQYWQRPGKEGKAWSATLGACGPYFYVFSSNASPFQPEHAYSPFSAYGLLDHAGDFTAAARALMPQRFAVEWPGVAVALPLLERLLTEPDARLAFETLPELSTLDREAWGAVKHAIKGLLGNVINLADLHAAWKKARRRPGGMPSPRADAVDTHADDKPVIYISPQMTTVVDNAQAAILGLPDAPRLFQRARQLCHIARGIKPPQWLKRDLDTPVIIQATPAYLRELVSKAAMWQKYDARANEWVEALPPTWAVETLLARSYWPFPPLEGIVCVPTLRPDGSLLDTPGYDGSTGLYCDFNGTDFPPIRNRPTLDDARSAIGRLQALVTDAERLLTAQAQQQVSLERELVQLRALVTDLGYTQDSYRNYR